MYRFYQAVTNPQDNKEKIEELKSKISELEYVGAKKAGTIYYQPNKFSFDLSKIL